MSRWFIEHRQQFIADCLRIYGQVNRASLMERFDISAPQASMDIGLFMRQNPDATVYDGTAKAYVVNLAALPVAPAEASPRQVSPPIRDDQKDPSHGQ